MELPTCQMMWVPTAEDERILRRTRFERETTSHAIRRAPRLLGHDEWLRRARQDAAKLADEDLNSELAAW
jgi:antitoxin ParD1/3/4